MTFIDLDNTDVEDLAEELRHTLNSDIELAAFRGSKEAIENHG